MSDHIDLDIILSDIGKFGKFQIINLFLLSIPIFLSGGFTLSYIFTAGNLDYRCQIPECENYNVHYDSKWFMNAIPYENLRFSKCSRYGFGENFTETSECSNDQIFNRSLKVTCDKFIYKDNELTILNEFNLTCPENEWKLALVGTVNNIALFIGMPVSGMLSDRYGRKGILLLGLICSAIFGTVRSLAQNYWTFIVAEFLDAALGSATYTAVFILGMEILCPKKRVLGGTIIAFAFSAGEAYLGLVAMLTRNFRTLLQILYIPSFFFISYYWLIPESLRWLIIKKRYDKVKEILLKIAGTNNIKLSDNLMNLLNDQITSQEVALKVTTISTITLTTSEVTGAVTENHIDVSKEEYCDGESIFRIMIKNPFLLLRIANCSYSWLTITFVYYGLSLNSVSLTGDKYVNFTLVSLAEIPGFMLCHIILDKIGRRWSLCSSLIISGLCCILSEYLSVQYIIKLILFLIGKAAITLSFTCVYIYTTEFFPTSMRHTLMSLCSMMGRIGSTLAPLTPLLMTYMESLPIILFAATSLTAGVFALRLPETVNTKLPDTVAEAKNLGRKNELM